MCYDISFSSSIELITKYLPEVVVDPQLGFDFSSGIHVFAGNHSRVPVIINDGGTYKLKEFEWGIITEYMDTDDKIKSQRLSHANARAEKILYDQRSFWFRIRSQRCLIPVQGIFEHRDVKKLSRKIPYYVWENDRSLFAIPGLYHYNSRVPSDEDTGEARGMFTLITRAANDIMSKIHNGGENPFRMPMFLPNEEKELMWLNSSLHQNEFKEVLEYVIPSESLNYHTVYTLRTDRCKVDGKTKIDPYTWRGLPPLGFEERTMQPTLF